MEEYLDTNKFNTLSELESYRRAINEALDERANFIALCNRAAELGEKSFLFEKNAFEAMAPALFESAEGKNILRKYTDVVKSSNNLSNLHALCENIRKANKSIDTDYFVNNIAGCDWKIDKKSLKEDMKKLGRVISEAYLCLGREKAESVMPKENKVLAEAVEYIAENERNYKNITEYSSAVKVLKEAIEGVEAENMFESKSLESVADNMILEFNKKYDEELDELEKELVKEVASNTNKSAIFDKYKTACLTKIEEKKESSKKDGNDAEYEKLATITEQVSKKSYNEEKFTEDVCSLVKMISILG